jgi:hypothetical protein
MIIPPDDDGTAYSGVDNFMLKYKPSGQIIDYNGMSCLLSRQARERERSCRENLGYGGFAFAYFAA